VALAISGIGFFLASFAKSSIASVRRERVQWLVVHEVPGAVALEALRSTPLGPSGSVAVLKYVTLGAAIVSAVAVAIAIGGIHWTLAYLAGAGALAAVGIVHVAAAGLARLYGERAALRLARPVRELARLLGPLLTLEERAAQSLTNPLGEEIAPAANGPAEGLGIDEDEETLDEHEARMIRGVVDLDRTIAREVMVPRVDMVTVHLGAPMSEVVRTMTESGHSRIPVTRGDVDHIEGIVHSREILGLLGDGNGTQSTLTMDIVRQALFIPEYKTLEELLREFQDTQRHIAIVVDEYGGVSGLVTIEDLLEEIVGEITDEFDVEEPGVEQVGDGEFVLDARIGIDDAGEVLSTELVGDGFDTLGGFVYQRLGRIARTGDFVVHDGLRFEVLSTAGRRVKRLRVTRIGEPGESVP
jgi:CBS domain containing-hemolysin-like protein